MREKGEIVWFNKNKGYGFISRPDKGDVFVHISAVTDPSIETLKEGQQVEFEVEQGRKGAQAGRVVVL